MKRVVVVFFLCLSGLVKAQDPKFSQYFASPLSLNPALTGYFDGRYRIAINTRQQWANIGEAYNTYSASGEVKFQDEYYYDDIFSIGFSGIYDESFNKILRSNNFSVSASYYKFLDPDHNFKLGLAPQLAYVTRKLDYDALTVASQFNNGAFDLSIPNNLGLDNDKLTYFDFNVGTNLALTLDRIAASLGFAMFHLTRPEQSFFNDVYVKLPYRKTLNASFRYLSQDLIDLNFSTHYLIEGKSYDLIFGGVVGLKPNIESNMKFNAGLWYKTNEKSYFPYVGLEFANASLGINYSLSTNEIAGYKPRTFELSLIIRDRNFTKFKNTCKF
jgi:type IX secretion system PorP/SprF family membrane protein